MNRRPTHYNATEHAGRPAVMAQAEGAIGPDHVAGELGELLLGRVAGRRAPAEITLFKSVGLAMQDTVTAAEVYRAAIAQGLGRDIPWG